MRGRGTGGAAGLLAACLIAAVPASGDVRAFRTADGSEDAAFLGIGPRSVVHGSVPDGRRGAYMIGRIDVNGTWRQMVHLRADGRVDSAFRPEIRGGTVSRGALHGRALAITGTFTAIGGRRRVDIAVLDARSGQPLDWAPAVTRPARSQHITDIAFAGATLVASAPNRLYGWRLRERRPDWTTIVRTRNIAPMLAAWRGSAMALGFDRRGHIVVRRIRPLDGDVHVFPGRHDHAFALSVAGGRLIVLDGTIDVLFDAAAARRLVTCGQAFDGSTYVIAVAGDRRALYAGDAPFSQVSAAYPGVTACPLAGRAARFRPPELISAPLAPLVEALAVVGSHVLMFTSRF